MKVRISYFYQIRNFKKNMIPISTALWDPKWFHDNRGSNYIFQDKRGIWNGIRCEAIIEQGRNSNGGPDHCPCEHKDSCSCSFLRQYKENLNKINFDKMYKDMLELAENYKEIEKIEDEIILVFIVYETPKNHCSERDSLIKFFNEHGIECKELEYPIQKLVPIKDEPFDF